MTDGADDDFVEPVYLSVRAAVAGVALALVAGLLALVGFDVLQPVYWLGVGIAFVGIAATASFGSRRSTIRYGVGLVSIALGVLVVGIGVHPGPLPLTVVGALVSVAGMVLVGYDTNAELVDR